MRRTRASRPDAGTERLFSGFVRQQELAELNVELGTFADSFASGSSIRLQELLFAGTAPALGNITGLVCEPRVRDVRVLPRFSVALYSPACL